MKYLKVGLFFLIFFLLILPFLILPRIIKVKEVECFSQYGICSDYIQGKIKENMGKSLYDAKKKISENFKNDNLVEKYSFQLKLPDKLRIDVILKKPKYGLLKKNTNEVDLVDGSGMVLEKIEKTNLPEVEISDNLPDIGAKVSSSEQFSLDLIYGIYYLYQIKSGEIVGDSFVVSMPTVAKIIFPLSGDRDVLLGSMKLILSRLNQDKDNLRIGKVKEIDLRYKNPVIRYE